MDAYQQEFIANIKRYRTERHLSQAKLAEGCDVSTATIGNIECGIAKPSFDLLLALARTLRVHPALLFSEKPFLPKRYEQEHEALLQIYKTIQVALAHQ